MTTIKDVAAKAGLSVSTVSRALNDAGDVSPQARKAALAAATDLNYRPHTAARNLRRLDRGQRELQFTVGLVLLDQTAYPTAPFFLELLSAIDTALQQRSFRIQIFPCARNGGVPREIEEGMVDGVIFQQSSGRLIPRVNSLVPCVALGGYYPADGVFSVFTDWTTGIAEALGRLYQSGRKRPVLLCDHPPGPRGMVTFMSMLHDGARKAFEEHGGVAAAPVCYPVAGTPDQGYARGLILFEDPAKAPDAVIASDGAMLGLYRAAHEAGLGIPDDICFIGTDGLAASAYMIPPLAVCDAHITEQTEKAVEILIDMINNGKRRRGMETIDIDFIPRASSGL